MENIVANNPDSEVFFFDETRLGTRTCRGYSWFLRGSRPTIRYNHGFKNFYLFGAVSPRTGKHFIYSLSTVDALCLNHFLREFSDWIGSKKVLLVMDCASWHVAKSLEVPSNIEIVYLSPYSPELNPIEKLWQYIKNSVIKNTLFTDLVVLQATVYDFVNHLSCHVVKSVCRVNYMPYYIETAH